jgi:energy-coupling factor transporter transmembrane protein EcfT
MIKKIYGLSLRMINTFKGMKYNPKQKLIVSIVTLTYCVLMILYMFVFFQLHDDRGNYEIIATIIFYAAAFTLAYLYKKEKPKTTDNE